MTKTCVVKGCDAPRMVSGAGKTLTRCEVHQREYWRDSQIARKAAGKTGPKRKPRVEQEAEPSPEWDAPEPEAPAVLMCEGCIYREMVEKLAAKDARIGELIAALERVRELERAVFDQAPRRPTTAQRPDDGGRSYAGEALVLDDSTLVRLDVTGYEAPGRAGDGDLAYLMRKAGGTGTMVLRRKVSGA